MRFVSLKRYEINNIFSFIFICLLFLFVGKMVKAEDLQATSTSTPIADDSIINNNNNIFNNNKGIDTDTNIDEKENNCTQKKNERRITLNESTRNLTSFESTSQSESFLPSFPNITDHKNINENESDQNQKPIHLIVLVHGMWGRPTDMGKLFEIMKGKFSLSKEDLKVLYSEYLSSTSNVTTSDNANFDTLENLVENKEKIVGEVENDEKNENMGGNTGETAGENAGENDEKEIKRTIDSAQDLAHQRDLEAIFDEQENVETVIKFSTSNYLLKTYHGVDVCGARLKNEVISMISELEIIETISELRTGKGIGISKGTGDREEEEEVEGGIDAERAEVHEGFSQDNIKDKNKDNNNGINNNNNNDGNYFYHHNVHSTCTPKENNIRSVKYISFIGYSAGGLFARYAIGLLHQEKFFQKHAIAPLNFITIATPHMGVRDNANTTSGKLINSVLDTTGYFYVGRSGQHMTLTDFSWVPEDKVYEPLLLIMSDPKQDFYQALKEFKGIFFYANARRDHTVNYITASLSSHNKYKLLKDIYDIDSVKIPIDTRHASYIKNYKYVKVLSRVDLEQHHERVSKKPLLLQYNNVVNSKKLFAIEKEETSEKEEDSLKNHQLPSPLLAIVDNKNNKNDLSLQKSVDSKDESDLKSKNISSNKNNNCSNDNTLSLENKGVHPTLAQRYGKDAVMIEGDIHEKIPSWLYSLIIPFGVIHTAVFFTPIRLISSVGTNWQTEYQHNTLYGLPINNSNNNHKSFSKFNSQDSNNSNSNSNASSTFSLSTATAFSIFSTVSTTDISLTRVDNNSNNNNETPQSQLEEEEKAGKKNPLHMEFIKSERQEQQEQQVEPPKKYESDYLEKVPSYILKNLASLPIHKIDVFLPSIHTHPTIMVRHPSMDSCGLDVLDHVANLLLYQTALFTSTSASTSASISASTSMSISESTSTASVFPSKSALKEKVAPRKQEEEEEEKEEEQENQQEKKNEKEKEMEVKKTKLSSDSSSSLESNNSPILSSLISTPPLIEEENRFEEVQSRGKAYFQIENQSERVEKELIQTTKLLAYMKKVLPSQ